MTDTDNSLSLEELIESCQKVSEDHFLEELMIIE